MKEALVIVDMQNDFITGSLANENAQRIVKPICDFIEQFDGMIYLTQDTHGDNYLMTREGVSLPVEHCIYGTAGWCIHDDILRALRKKNYEALKKNSFTCYQLMVLLEKNCETIYVCGTVSEICVVSNALMLRNAYNDKKIVVLEDLCAGLDEEGQNAAMKVMRSCQIDVVKAFS